MIEKLVEFVLSIIGALVPWAIIPDYSEAVVLRLGRWHRTLKPGFHWRYPLGIELVMHEIVVPRTASLDSLATTTKDGKQIGVHAIVTYKVADIRKYLLDTHDGADAIRDSCTGTMGVVLADHTWEDIVHGLANEPLAKACRRRGWAWGIEVVSVQLAGVAMVRNLRLIHAGLGHEKSSVIELAAG